MKKQYDFSTLTPNPYVRRLKQLVAIGLDEDTVENFKQMAASTGIANQNLISLHLRECASERRKLRLA
jgi:uncharacterized protein (DUF4415 family)